MKPVFALPLLLLAACGSDAAKDDAHNTIVVESETIVVPQANVDAPATGNIQAADDVAKVNLAPDGLSLVLPTGSARHVTFGQPRGGALDAISAALGDPIEQGENQDCGAGMLGFAHFRGGLSLYFQEGKFVGWDLDGQDGGDFATASGVGIGSTRAQLEDSLAVTVEDSTLGVEFSAGHLSGLLSSRDKNAEITNLWAGATCIAR